MISHKCYSNPHVLIIRSNALKDSSRGFYMNSEISFLISVRKTFLISDQIFDVTLKNFSLGTKRTLCIIVPMGDRTRRKIHNQVGFASFPIGQNIYKYMYWGVKVPRCTYSKVFIISSG